MIGQAALLQSPGQLVVIQPFSLGTSITRIDGGSIATGTIDGSDAILSGSLTADRINASSIQASTVFIPAVANGLNSGVGGTWIDGGAIRTGTVDTNRLNASTIVTAINGQATTISGSKITTGTITVGHMTADSLTAGKIKASLLDVDGMITVVNGGSVTKISGTGIATTSITTNHIATAGLSADVIKTGSITSQGTGGVYQSYNYINDTAFGFKLAHAPFNALNKWNRTQSVQAEFGSTVLVHGYPLGPALGIPLSALDFPPLDQLSSTSRVFYRGNIDTATRGGAPNIACLTVTRDRWDTTNKIMRFTFKLQPSALSDNLDGLRYAKVAITRNNVAVKCSAKCSMTVNATAKTVTRNDGGSFVADGFVAGDIPLFTGFTNTTNNNVGYWKCAGVTASTITLNAGTTGLVNETATAAQVAIYDGPTSTDLGTFYVPLKDRLYAHATDSDPSNAVYITWTESDAGVSTGVPALAVTLYNAYGASATYYYVSRTASYGDGIALFSSGSSLPPGVYGYVPPGGDGGGSGGAGGGCTPAGTPFETAQGVVPVETVQVGDLALAYDENTLKPHYARVTRVFVHENRQLYSIQTDRGELICSHDHRLALVADVHSVEYPPARELEAGDLIYYRLPSGVVVTALVTKVTPLDRFETVYHCTLESGHVYVAGGFLAHNMIKLGGF